MAAVQVIQLVELHMELALLAVVPDMQDIAALRKAYKPAAVALDTPGIEASADTLVQAS